MNPINEQDLQGLLVNPFYAVVFTDEVIKQHKDLNAKEDWVLLNARLVEEIGEEEWLKELLDVLSQSREEYDGHDIINPTTTINISNNLHADHPLLVTREQWVQANAKLMNEIGVNAWLERLLETLETGGPDIVAA